MFKHIMVISILQYPDLLLFKHIKIVFCFIAKQLPTLLKLSNNSNYFLLRYVKQLMVLILINNSFL